ncbi:MAG: HAD hydrolase family protein [Gemmatimonadota bacterium]|nr:HAD hydrolase family protein [Gemmatimonadota bacterium]
MVDPVVAKRIRVVGFDVDGVMTDAGVYIGSADERPVELKRFDIQDNVGLKLLKGAGIRVVVVSGRSSPATTLRAAELEIDDLVQDDSARKLGPFQDLLAKHGVGMDEAAFVGDDLPDLPVLRRVALPVAVANAVPEVAAVCHYTTRARGGHGAVREFCEALLRARGEWEAMVERYRVEREGEPSHAG